MTDYIIKFPEFVDEYHYYPEKPKYLYLGDWEHFTDNCMILDGFSDKLDLVAHNMLLKIFHRYRKVTKDILYHEFDYIIDIIQKHYDSNVEIQCYENEDGGVEINPCGYYPSIVDNYCKKFDVSLEEFLTNDEYVVVLNVDKEFDDLRAAGIFVDKNIIYSEEKQ